MDVAFKEAGGLFDGVVCVYNGSKSFYTNVPLDLPEVSS